AFPQSTFEDKMILKILTRGDSERLIAKVARDLVQLQIFIGRKVAARDFGANHEAPCLVEPGLSQLTASVPVVLLVRPTHLRSGISSSPKWEASLRKVS